MAAGLDAAFQTGPDHLVNNATTPLLQREKRLWRTGAIRSSRLFLLILNRTTLTSCLPWSRHTSRNVITRTIFAFLFLEHRIIHVDIVEHGSQIFMPQ